MRQLHVTVKIGGKIGSLKLKPFLALTIDYTGLIEFGIMRAHSHFHGVHIPNKSLSIRGTIWKEITLQLWLDGVILGILFVNFEKIRFSY